MILLGKPRTMKRSHSLSMVNPQNVAGPRIRGRLALKLYTTNSGASYREGATILIHGRLTNPGSSVIPYSMTFVIRDESEAPIGASTDLRTDNIINPFNGKFEFLFDAPPPKAGETQRVFVHVFARFLVDREWVVLSDKLPIILHSRNSTVAAQLDPTGAATGEFGITFDPPQPGGPFRPMEPVTVSGRTALIDDKAFLQAIFVEKSTKVISDSFIAKSWLRVRRNIFSGVVVVPNLPPGPARPHSMVVQILRISDGFTYDCASQDVQVKPG
jgi:hypothetical protein